MLNDPTLGIDAKALAVAIDHHHRAHRHTFAAVKRAPVTTGLSTVVGKAGIESHPAPPSEPETDPKKLKVEKECA